MIAYKSNTIVTPNGIISGYIEVENNKICGVGNETQSLEIVDYFDRLIIAGIFDTHNHGAFGYSLMGSKTNNVQEIKGFLDGILSQGVTSVFPTASTNMFSEIADCANILKDTAQILGIHSEGPWLNRVGEKGIRTGWPEVSLEFAKQMVKDAKGYLKLVALAPEIPNIKPIYEYFINHGITVAMAHSDQNYIEAMTTYSDGISVATHTGNVMTGLHHRDVGGLGASLLHPNVDCEIICDGKHVSLEMLGIYFKMKDYSKFMMISDNTPLTGAPKGKYTLFENMDVTITDDGFCLSDTGRLMGSTIPVIIGIKNLVNELHIPLEIVSKMASLNPAKKYGFSETKGSLEVGKDADFVVLDNEFNVLNTYVLGKCVYDHTKNVVIFNKEFMRGNYETNTN